MAEMAKQGRSFRDYLKSLGPGLVSGASNADPACIGTYAKAGASLGTTLLWVPFFVFPLVLALQYISAKVSLTSGRSLGGLLRKLYPGLTYPVLAGLVIANILEAGADLGAMAAAVNLLLPVPPRALVIVLALSILLLQFFGTYRIIKKTFKWLTLALFGYIGAGLISGADIGDVLERTFIPQADLSAYGLSILVALCGATLSPYLFFWMTAHHVENEKAEGKTSVKERKGASGEELKLAGIDAGTGMFFSSLVIYFVMMSSASTLFKSGHRDITSAVEAASALKPVAGEWAEVLWSAGILGAGLLAVPVLTGSAAYAVSEAFGMRRGLEEKPWSARGFYAVITASTALGVLMDLAGINPIKALYIVEVINGLLAPPVILIMLLISNNKAVVGNKRNSTWINMAGALCFILTFLAAAGMVYTWVSALFSP